MRQTVQVLNSFKEKIRIEECLSIDDIVIESIFLLNIGKKIEPISISNELGISLRNLNEKEINICKEKIKEQIKLGMLSGYENVLKYEKVYSKNIGEIEIMSRFLSIDSHQEYEFYKSKLNYIYAKILQDHSCMNKENIYSKPEDFVDIDKTSDQIATNICSKLIVVEVKDYQKIYQIIDHYYNLNRDLAKMNYYSNEFIFNLIKLCNIIFLEEDSSSIMEKEEYNFQIYKLEDFSFDILKIVNFFDNYFHAYFKDKKISKNLKKIKNIYIDQFLKDDQENINNLIFLTTKLSIYYNKLYGFNYKDYNLALISSIELLLVNSNSKEKVSEKFTKNILVCLAIQNNLMDEQKEKNIIREIYSYRSSIAHGNYSQYKSNLCNLEKMLSYVKESYEYNKNDTIEKLISKKLNFYIKNIFEVNSKNPLIIKMLKN